MTVSTNPYYLGLHWDSRVNPGRVKPLLNWQRKRGLIFDLDSELQ